jgi:hypothetical protein
MIGEQPAAAQAPTRSAAEPARSAATDGLEVAYDAPAICPNRDSWLEQVAARRGGAAELSAESLARALAGLAIDTSGTQARLRFRGSDAERVISGRNCDEVSSAAALIVAIALGSAEHEAAAEVPSSPIAEAHAALAASAALGPTRPERAVELFEASSTVAGAEAAAVSRPPAASLSPATSAAAAPTPEPDAGTALGQSHTRLPAWRFALGMGAEANNWLGPWPAAVFDASFDALAPTRTWSTRLAGVFGRAQRRLHDRLAEFRFWGGRIDVCPFSLARDSSWRWSNCAAAQLGALHAWGDEESALAEGYSRTTAWAALELRSRLQTPLVWAFRFEAETGLSAPLLGREFQFGAPAESVFDSPRVGVFGRAGILVPLGGALD